MTYDPKQPPTRVVINKEGEAVPAWMAEREGIKPVIVFVRNDGWTLGAPEEFIEVARKMWDGEWVEEVRLDA